MSGVRPALRPLLVNPIHLLSLGFGSGLAPRAPGTAGTVVGLILYVPLSSTSLPVYLGVVAVAFVAGVMICDYTAKRLGVHDHPAIVWDEIVGIWVALIGAPAGWAWVVVGFVLFRCLDIAKPWPISLADRRVSGGLGIMLDDLIAALVALGSLHILHRFLSL